ncbi:cbb3-type cytochrome oxidase assembly protein CcoS [Flavobacterium sp. I3-2]|uniref:cbb3-type cytochrome oxidase assembly protein CcoS n=1 Tax=Flavobacterium sp. I3-2 TaxID=2748319 RepID=UPI0015A9D535|nr:cbb3-type cytochrome oxidase assembly protein CcoS [Flavobacterium sp. I3-2]
MGVIYILICISIFVAAVFLFLFIKSVKNGQFDDDYTPSVRMLFEDELKSNSDLKSNTNTEKTKTTQIN